ncbi:MULTISPECIES: helix-turn-helix domain-containing protein [Avibacterium]|uniref:helix-turn-helix domain-containing protein n=1 Tax=Avibacterium TaxID=292486 RepID=UPI002026BB01|nr:MULTISPECIES: helix-turn-helix transcriptional regulator [unclassified Avibacterium]MCW9733922.1 helix-turn-helix transcriptional regulator [Avibacterium sp. 20-15]URL01054.1 helix-turn-helix transcriptional regulator [Avibacterium sp. 20-126]URL03921.1 helix-turn-helix transcriptional regulator [Avibacterium sp. 20-132]
MKTLEQLLDEFSPEARQRIEQKAEELLLESGLSSIRQEMEISQKQLADALGISQPAVAQIEQRGNELRLSTLKRYVETMGGKLSLAIDMPMGETRIFKI